jgi:hypothetical protein
MIMTITIEWNKVMAINRGHRLGLKLVAHP